MKCLNSLNDYWHIDEPVRLAPHERDIVTGKDIIRAFKICTVMTALLLLFLFLGVLL